MKIINTTKNTLIAREAVVADNFFTRLKGLLGKNELKDGGALIIRRCNSIHTFFMRFSIDAVFVDKGNRVVKTLSNIRPYRLSGIYPNADYVIELPAGTILATNTSTSDSVNIID